jgi:hypothetical protein
MLGLVVEEPGGQVVLGVKGVTGETVVDELSERLFAVDELGSEGDGFGCVESSV